LASLCFALKKTTLGDAFATIMSKHNMSGVGKDLIPQETCQTLKHFFSSLSREQATLLDQINDEIILNIPQYVQMTDFRRPVQKVEVIFLQKTAHHCQADLIVLRRALVAKLALQLPGLVEKMNFPASLLALFPDAFANLADFLNREGDEPYDLTGDYFCKDIRFVLGLTIPNGALVFDMKSRITLPSVILSLFRSKSIDGMIRYVRAGGTGLWFRGHLDLRYLTEMNERGFDNFFIRVAELLERRKDIKGYVGTSWLQAPQLPDVSPHLAYFQKPPREGGAFLLRHGTQSSDIENAIKASETRRRLYQEGKYMPICYSMVWPRNELIVWAKRNNQEKC
jgi:hypothetical protein